MHFLDAIQNALHKIFIGLVLIATNATSNPPLEMPTSPPAVLEPTGSIVLTSSTTPISIDKLFSSPFREKPAPAFVPVPAQSVTKPIATSTKPKLTFPEKPKATPAVKPAPVTPAPAPAPVPQPVPAPQPEIIIAPSDLNSKARASVVNILCNVGGSGSLNPISGTGIIIDPSGIVLTNAHVGQFFLLRNYPTKNNIDCVLRTGNPAKATYTAELLYFPLEWMKQNAEKIIQQNPSSTGERDYAFLYITGTTDKSALPASFPYLSPYTGDVFDLGDEILLAGYPAGFIDGITVQTNLYTSSAFGKISEIFTFKDGGQADLLSIPGTILSQKGASGGAAVRGSDGKIVGLIATATTATETSQRDLRAITLGHIDRSLTEDTGRNLNFLLSNDGEAMARIFNLTVAPTLTKMLLRVLDR